MDSNWKIETVSTDQFKKSKQAEKIKPEKEKVKVSKQGLVHNLS